MENVLFKQAPLFAAFDPKLANFLIGLACSHDAPPSIAHNIARRAVDEREDGRLYPRLVAQALLGDDCAPANELPEALHKKLDELAVRRDIRQ